MIAIGCGSSGGSEVVRFRSSGVAGALVNDGAGVTAHRWLKVAFIPSNLVKATFSHHRTASEATTVTPTTSAPPQTPLSPSTRATPKSGKQRPRCLPTSSVSLTNFRRMMTRLEPLTSVNTAWSDVEPELDHVAVGHEVVLAFHADLAGGAGGGHRAGGHQVVVG